MPENIGTGNHDITIDGDQNAEYVQGESTEIATSGTLTIDSLTEDQISGGFTFITENGIEITEGNFELGL